MKYISLIFIILLACVGLSLGQTPSPPNNILTFSSNRNDTYLYSMNLLSYDLNITKITGESFQFIFNLAQGTYEDSNQQLVIYSDNNNQMNLGYLDSFTGEVVQLGGFQTPSYLQPYNIIKQSMGYDPITKNLYYVSVYHEYVYMITAPLNNGKPIVTNTGVSCQEIYADFALGVYNGNGNYLIAIFQPATGYRFLTFDTTQQSITQDMSTQTKVPQPPRPVLVSYQGIPYLIELGPDNIFYFFQILINETQFFSKLIYTLPYDVDQNVASTYPGFLGVVGSNSVPTSTSYLVTFEYPNLRNPLVYKFPANLNSTNFIYFN